MSKKQPLAIEQLAEYFTGPDVAFFSICLEMPDGNMDLAGRAKRFFAVRRALGIGGYANKEEALAAIERLFVQRIPTEVS